jgi:hypothetical protein
MLYSLSSEVQKNGCAQLDVSHRMRDRASSFQRRSIQDQTSLRPLQGKLSSRVSSHARLAPSIAGKVSVRRPMPMYVAGNDGEDDRSL